MDILVVFLLVLVHQDDVFSTLVLPQIPQDFEELCLELLESEDETGVVQQVQEQLQEWLPFVEGHFQDHHRHIEPGHFHTV
jgi:hypothetical protein